MKVQVTKICLTGRNKDARGISRIAGNGHDVLRLILAMPVQYELRRLFHLMNIQTHRNSTQKALFLGAYFNS